MFLMWSLLAVAQCALLYILARKGETLPGLKEKDSRANAAVPEAQWPTVGLIVPVAGRNERMELALRSLLTQDYPNYTPVLVTAQDQDPAMELILKLKEEFPAVRHVTAGEAYGCGQKNHNSLRGVALLGDTVDVYAFCDSTHRAERDFLRHLVGPLARGEAAFTTGYHRVEPEDEGNVTLAYTVSVLLMRLLQAMARFTQLWGGAMAMTRQAWEKYGVAQLWSENVVDDCSLSALLQVRGVGVRLCPGALLHTGAARLEASVWRAWMDRQVGFLKFCMPAQWVLLGILAVIFAVPLLCALLALLGGLVHVGSGAGVLLSVFWLACVVSALHLWRAMLPRPVCLWRWCLAYAAAVRMFSLVYLNSLRTRSLLWHGIRYTVRQGGTVEGTERL